MTLTDWLRARVARPLDAAGRALHRVGVSPNALTVVGTLLTGAAALLIGGGRFAVALPPLLLGGLCDALDGAVARAAGRETPLGALLDSTLDRYADGVLFAALGYDAAANGQTGRLVLALAALLGSTGVSYVRARAAAPDVAVHVTSGWLTRVERLALLVVGLAWPPLLTPVLWLLAVGTNVTTLQRLWAVNRALRQREGNGTHAL